MLDKRLAVMSEAAPHIRRALLHSRTRALCALHEARGQLRGHWHWPGSRLTPFADAWKVLLHYKLARFTNDSAVDRNSIGAIKKCLSLLQR